MYVTVQDLINEDTANLYYTFLEHSSSFIKMQSAKI